MKVTVVPGCGDYLRSLFFAVEKRKRGGRRRETGDREKQKTVKHFFHREER